MTTKCIYSSKQKDKVVSCETEFWLNEKLYFLLLFLGMLFTSIISKLVFQRWKSKNILKTNIRHFLSKIISESESERSKTGVNKREVAMHFVSEITEHVFQNALVCRMQDILSCDCEFLECEFEVYKMYKNKKNPNFIINPRRIDTRLSAADVISRPLNREITVPLNKKHPGWNGWHHFYSFSLTRTNFSWLGFSA